MKFKYFDQLLERVESLTTEDVDNGLLVDLAYYAAVNSREWGVCADQMRVDLTYASEIAGIDTEAAIFDVNDGLHLGLAAVKGYCNLRESHPAKQAGNQ